jgi:DNA-binding transcriptional LysR family regulator
MAWLAHLPGRSEGTHVPELKPCHAAFQHLEVSMDKLLALRTFVTAAQEGGFAAAARRLQTSASSVTRIIAALETELGTALINRSARQMTLTDCGSHYLQRAQQILVALEDADKSINDRGCVARGALRVSLPVDFARCVVSPALGCFLREHPLLDLSLILSDEVVDLIGARVDVAVRLGHLVHSPDVVVRKIGQFQRWLVASPYYLAQHTSPSTLVDLAAHQCLLFDYKPGGQQWAFVSTGNEQRINVSGRLRSNNVQMLRQACLGGAGLALLPDWLVDLDVASGQLVRLFPDHVANPNNAGDSINLVFLPSQRGSTRVAVFADYLAREMSNR